MINGWVAPAVGIFIATQAAAAVWWASGTNQQVNNNTTAIEQVIENEKEIAVIQVQQAEIVKDVGEIKDDGKEVKGLINDIVQTLNRWENDD